MSKEISSSSRPTASWSASRQMEQEASGFDFARVDETGHAQSFVEYLDTVAAATREYKRVTLELQQAHEGDTLLELGCGTGDDARILAGFVGSSGRVIGVDNSEAMIAEARRRAEGSGLPVEYRIGDADRLEFPDDTFDGCRSERVFQHLPDPRRALAEVIRVTRPGGRIVIADPDWETLVVDCSDRALMRRIRSFFCDSVGSGSIAHEMRGLMHELGLADITVTPLTVVLADYGAADLMLELEKGIQRARDARAISEDERADWVAELRERDKDGRFFLALTGFATGARST